MTKAEAEQLEKSRQLVEDEFWPDGVEAPGKKVVAVINATNTNNMPVKAKDDIVAKAANQDWQSLSRSLGLELYERQPEETDNEWLAWMTYRDYYPGKLPTMSELASKLGSSVATLLKYSQKWSWKTRMLHWARATDADSMTMRREAIHEMNKKQLSIANTMMDKLVEAMDYLDPTIMKPSEITNMLKLAAGMQKEINMYVDDKIEQPALDANVVKQSQVTKKEDISDIAQILASVGVLDGKMLGIKQTTEVVLKEDNND